MAAIGPPPNYSVTFLGPDVTLGALGAQAAEGAVVMYGTPDEIEGTARRLRLGDAELRARKARRKAQRASRRANR